MLDTKSLNIYATVLQHYELLAVSYNKCCCESFGYTRMQYIQKWPYGQPRNHYIYDGEPLLSYVLTDIIVTYSTFLSIFIY